MTFSSTIEYSFYNGFMIVGFTNEPNVGAKWSLFNKYGRKSDTKNTLEVGFTQPVPAETEEWHYLKALEMAIKF